MILRRVQEFRVAVMFLTRLPVGRIAEPVPTIAAAQWAYPWVGLIVGAISWGVFSLFLALGATATLAAIFSFAAMVVSTGGLHQDGLADTADGLGGGRNREHCLEIMRDSRIGTYGVLALILVTLIWINALGEIGSEASIASFIAVAVVSRAAMNILLLALGSAREEGLGAQAVGGGSWAILSVLLSFGLAVLLLGSQTIFVVLAALFAASIIGFAARSRIKGHTGDILGASQFLSEALCWSALALSI